LSHNFPSHPSLRISSESILELRKPRGSRPLLVRRYATTAKKRISKIPQSLMSSMKMTPLSSMVKDPSNHTYLLITRISKPIRTLGSEISPFKSFA
jgi:hypothetical protein